MQWVRRRSWGVVGGEGEVGDNEEGRDRGVREEEKAERRR